jgi:hypothetical protein
MGLAPYGEPLQGPDDRKADGPEGRRHLPAEHGLFQLLHRPDHDQRPVQQLFGGPPRGRRTSCSTSAHGHGRLGPGGDRGGGAAAGRSADRGDRHQQSLPGRRRGAQLRRQRQAAARRRFDNLWVQPAAGDAGGALGAALLAYHLHAGPPRPVDPAIPDAMRGAYLGPAFRQEEIENAAAAAGARFDRARRRRRDRRLRRPLAEGKASAGSRAAWSSARARSAPARSSATRARPPCRRRSTSRSSTARASGRSRRRCCAEDVATGSSWTSDSPYMLLVADVVEPPAPPMTRRGGGAVRHRQAQRAALGDPGRHPRRLLGPHADGARGHQPALLALLQAFKQRTGCPVLVNTSFNVRGEPIVCTPEDAFRCFMGTRRHLKGSKPHCSWPRVCVIMRFYLLGRMADARRPMAVTTVLRGKAP